VLSAEGEARLGTQDSGHRTQGLSTQDSGLRTQHSGLRTQDSALSTQHSLFQEHCGGARVVSSDAALSCEDCGPHVYQVDGCIRQYCTASTRRAQCVVAFVNEDCGLCFQASP
jgi:hypothetical protein